MIGGNVGEDFGLRIAELRFNADFRLQAFSCHLPHTANRMASQ